MELLYPTAQKIKIPIIEFRYSKIIIKNIHQKLQLKILRRYNVAILFCLHFKNERNNFIGTSKNLRIQTMTSKSMNNQESF